MKNSLIFYLAGKLILWMNRQWYKSILGRSTLKAKRMIGAGFNHSKIISKILNREKGIMESSLILKRFYKIQGAILSGAIKIGEWFIPSIKNSFTYSFFRTLFRDTKTGTMQLISILLATALLISGLLKMFFRGMPVRTILIYGLSVIILYSLSLIKINSRHLIRDSLLLQLIKKILSFEDELHPYS